MDGEKWQARAKAAGLTQRRLAQLLGYAPNTVSRQLRGIWQTGVPRQLIAAIIAWEMMSVEQREEWLRRVEDEAR